MTTSYASPRRRTAPLLAGTAVLAALATVATVAGCGGHGGKGLPTGAPCLGQHTAPCMSPSSSTSPARPAGVVTLTQARDLLARYVRINNRANAAVGTTAKAVAKARGLNNQIEAGPLQAQSRAEFTTYRVATAKDRAYDRTPFAYAGTTWYIPRTSAFSAGQQPFFAAISHVKDNAENKAGKRARVIIFARQSDASWKMTATVDLDGHAPALARDSEGYAEALAPDTSPGLAMRPDRLPLAINDNYTTGGKSADGAALAATADAKDQRGTVGRWAAQVRPVGRSVASAAQDPYQAVYALRTATGGALTVVSSAHELEDYVVLPGGTITTSAHDESRAWVGATTTDLTVTYGCLDAAVIPTAGKTVQIGTDCQIEHAASA